MDHSSGALGEQKGGGQDDWEARYKAIDAEYAYCRKCLMERTADMLAAQAKAETLANMVRWSVKHDGECLGDHPELLELAKAAIAKALPE